MVDIEYTNMDNIKSIKTENRQIIILYEDIKIKKEIISTGFYTLNLWRLQY